MLYDESYDVFISYRREGGFEAAQMIVEKLHKDGFAVSFDMENLRSGDFDKSLFRRIERCVDFLLIVDRHCFDKVLDGSCPIEQDWLRQELAYALHLKKNVIPILLEGSNWPDGLPEEIVEVKKKNALFYIKVYLDTFYDRLKGFMFSHPCIGINNERQVVVQSGNRLPDIFMQPSSYYLKLKSDMNCDFYLDGIKTLRLNAGEIVKFPLRVGEYEMMFVSSDNPADRIVETYVMTSADKLHKVVLSGILKARMEREEAERKEREEKERIERESLERERLEQDRIQRERMKRERQIAEEKAKRLSDIGAINGVFSISPVEKVHFSKGNLCYLASEGIWRFSEQQYDFKGITNQEIAPDNQNWIDLFGFGTGKNPTEASRVAKDYGSFTDWGTNPVVNGGNQANLWRTLKKEEWEYLFRERQTFSGVRFAKAKVNGVNGLLLFPDEWAETVCPIKESNRDNARFISNTIPLAKWKGLEATGVVFLPAAGYRGAKVVEKVGLYGNYWSRSFYYSNSAFNINFSDSDLNLDSNYDRSYGRSVRLVCPAN